MAVILGPSGCGKTTLLKIVAGLVEPDQGDFSLKIDGQNITKPGPDRNIVFQDYASYPWLTIIENVRFSLQFRAMPRPEQDRRAEEYVKMVGLWDYRDEYPRVLSGGQQQRVAIARTLAGDPQVILMDEPFAALDAQTREAMQSELLQLQRKTNCTILFVTHDISEAAYLGDRVLILSQIPSRIVDEMDTRSEGPLLSRFIDLRPLAGTVDEDPSKNKPDGDEDYRYGTRFLAIRKKLKDKLPR